MASELPTVYRLAPAVVMRLVGLALVAMALLLLAVTTVVVILDAPATVLVVAGAAAALGATAFGWWLHARAWVLRCTGSGYRVALVRGVGVRAARWSEVEAVVATYRHDVACLELRLRDGGTSTLPVALLAVDRDQLAGHLRDRLQRHQGLPARSRCSRRLAARRGLLVACSRRRRRLVRSMAPAC